MIKQTAYFISIEGIEGVGKSSIISGIAQLLKNKNIHYVLSREPGGTPIAEAIRQVLLGHYDEKMCADTEILLMFAGRAQNIAQVIKPALAKGIWVISDRFTDASFAYQGGGRGISMERIAQLAQWVHADLMPDLTILLDAPVDIGLSRVTSRGAKDRIELETVTFFQKVRDCYLQLAHQHPDRFALVDASQDFNLVQQQVEKIIYQFISDKVNSRR